MSLASRDRLLLPIPGAMGSRRSLVLQSHANAQVEVHARRPTASGRHRALLFVPWALASALLVARFARFSLVYVAALLLLDVLASAALLGYLRRRRHVSTLRLVGDQLWVRTALGTKRLCSCDSVSTITEIPVRRTAGYVLLQDAAGATKASLSLELWPREGVELLTTAIGQTVSLGAPCGDLLTLAKTHPGATRFSARAVAVGGLVLIATVVTYILAVQAVFDLPPVTGP